MSVTNKVVRTILCLLFLQPLTYVFIAKPVYAQTSPSTTLSANPPTITVNAQSTLTLALSNSSNLGAFEFSLNFDTNKVQIDSVQYDPFITSSGRTAIPVGPIIDTSSGTITYGVSTIGANPGVSGNGSLALITLTGLQAGVADFSLASLTVADINGTPISTSLPNSTQITIQSITSPTPSPTQSPVITPTLSPSPTPTTTPFVSPTPSNLPTPFPTPSSSSANLILEVDPSTSVPTINQPLKVNLRLTTTSNVTGVDAILNLNPNLFTINQITDLGEFNTSPLHDFNNGNGQIRFSAVNNPGKTFTGSAIIASFQITPKLSQDTSIIFNFTPGSKSESNVIEATTGNDILTQPQSLNLLAINPSTLQIQLNTWNEVGNNALEGMLEGDAFSQTVTTSESGLSQLINLPSNWFGQLKEFTFKVSGFLKKRFTHTPTSGNSVVNIGQLKAGDLNNDGIINTIDLGIMYPEWGLAGASDFNGDGVINTADYWIIIQNYLQEDE